MCGREREKNDFKRMLFAESKWEKEKREIDICSDSRLCVIIREADEL